MHMMGMSRFLLLRVMQARLVEATDSFATFEVMMLALLNLGQAQLMTTIKTSSGMCIFGITVIGWSFQSMA